MSFEKYTPAPAEFIEDRRQDNRLQTKQSHGAWQFSHKALLTAILFGFSTGVYVWCQSGVEKEDLNTDQASNRVAAENMQAAPITSSRSSTAETEFPAKSEQLKENYSKSFINKAGQNYVVLRTTENAVDSMKSIRDEASVSNNDLQPVDIDPVNAAPQNSFALPMEKTFSVIKAVQKTGIEQNNQTGIGKGLSLGVELSHPAAIDYQKASGLDMSGKESQWRDYIPSVYTQFHFSKHFYLQAAWSPVATQYTPNYTLYHNSNFSSPEMREERTIKLEKLFYTNIPFSFHYNTPLKGVTVGAGLQYSLLKKIVLQDQQNDYLIGATHWEVNETSNEIVVKEPGAAQRNSSGDAADNVAASFRREDWRLLADVSYGNNVLYGGLRFSGSWHPYINSSLSGTQIKDRNETLQVYLSYNIFNTRKK